MLSVSGRVLRIRKKTHLRCDRTCPTTSEGSLARVVFGSEVGVNPIHAVCRHLCATLMQRFVFSKREI